MKESERKELNDVSQLIRSSKIEWKRVGILIGFKKWDREAWGNVSGLGYANTKCK